MEVPSLHLKVKYRSESMVSFPTDSLQSPLPLNSIMLSSFLPSHSKVMECTDGIFNSYSKIWIVVWETLHPFPSGTMRHINIVFNHSCHTHAQEVGPHGKPTSAGM